jgi:hypothetical protein
MRRTNYGRAPCLMPTLHRTSARPHDAASEPPQSSSSISRKPTESTIKVGAVQEAQACRRASRSGKRRSGPCGVKRTRGANA